MLSNKRQWPFLRLWLVRCLVLLIAGSYSVLCGIAISRGHAGITQAVWTCLCVYGIGWVLWRIPMR